MSDVYGRSEISSDFAGKAGERYRIALAGADDFDAVRKLDMHIPEDRLLKCIEEQQVFVIRRSGHIAGMCRYSLFWQTIPFLDLLYIDEADRNQGCGTALMTCWEKAMNERGYQYVMLSTQENESARFFYEKLDFRCVGSFCPPEQDYDELIYVKDFCR